MAETKIVVNNELNWWHWLMLAFLIGIFIILLIAVIVAIHSAYRVNSFLSGIICWFKYYVGMLFGDVEQAELSLKQAVRNLTRDIQMGGDVGESFKTGVSNVIKGLNV